MRDFGAGIDCDAVPWVGREAKCLVPSRYDTQVVLARKVRKISLSDNGRNARVIEPMSKVRL
jgi:hypothetical protein